ncbi:hypothetical protein AMAG_11087 [Allomyces macrogynus ATCC 38327]|uniref:Uncharacterized protein n=1 Tax=Allomyces macrogynus (strain ATCC 38327) TaxID=578462 RepID=A0A0L0ST16_ALLM3|nr:hypothetical protein AMAG_11087 [Allomyces macrogynus ATCC 38327]|eukprot:KNE65464.1 hypothetical protein AMAG_11087 [Allomyces macrogynus ATCC 38327]
MTAATSAQEAIRALARTLSNSPSAAHAVLANEVDIMGPLATLREALADPTTGAEVAEAVLCRDQAYVDVVLKILAESVPSDQMAGNDSAVETLAHVRDRCLAILANAARSPTAAKALVDHAPFVEVVLPTFLSDPDARLLTTCFRLFLTLHSALPKDPSASLPLLIAVLDARALDHVLAIITATRSPTLLASAVPVATAWTWTLHSRLALDPEPGMDAAFPVVPRETVQGAVNRLATALVGPDAGLTWAVAELVVKALGTFAMIGPEWQALLDLHGTALVRVFMCQWPSIARDAHLSRPGGLAGCWVQLVAQLTSHLDAHQVVARLHRADSKVAVRALATTALEHTLPDIAARAVPFLAPSDAAALVRDEADAVAALNVVAPDVARALAARAMDSAPQANGARSSGGVQVSVRS